MREGVTVDAGLADDVSPPTIWCMIDQECACPWRHPPGEDEFRHVVSIVAPGVAVTGQPMRSDPVPMLSAVR